jgi:hypothetical protein
MRILPVVALLGLLLAGTAFADTITVSAPWTQVRRTPSLEGRAIDVVYGNDSFEVLESQGGWVKIRTARKVVGWIPTSPAEQAARKTAPAETKAPAKDDKPDDQAPAGKKPAEKPPGDKPPGEKKAGAESPGGPQNLRATALTNGISLRQLGYGGQAREKFTGLMLSDPGSVEAYEATRQMLSYHLVGYLPPLQQGKVTEEGQALIGTVTADVLLQEAIALQGEKQFAPAARVYQALLDQNPNNGRAFLGLLDTLGNAMADSLKNKKEQDLERQAATHKKYFPNSPLPEGVQQRLAQGGK